MPSFTHPLRHGGTLCELGTLTAMSRPASFPGSSLCFTPSVRFQTPLYGFPQQNGQHMTGYTMYLVHPQHKLFHTTQIQDRRSSSQCVGERRPRRQFLYIAYSRSALYGVHTILVGSTCGDRQLSAAAMRRCVGHGQSGVKTCWCPTNCWLTGATLLTHARHQAAAPIFLSQCRHPAILRRTL